MAIFRAWLRSSQREIGSPTYEYWAKSSWMESALPPAQRTLSTVSTQLALFEMHSTSEPWRARSRAMARPIPRPAPVTIASSGATKAVGVFMKRTFAGPVFASNEEWLSPAQWCRALFASSRRRCGAGIQWELPESYSQPDAAGGPARQERTGAAPTQCPKLPMTGRRACRSEEHTSELQ